MGYSSQKVKIEKVTDTDIACALAYLSGFRKGTFIGRINNIYRQVNSPNIVVVFHKETLDKVDGDIAEALACLGPNIIVGQFYKRPENESKFKPTDEYLIEFDDKVYPSNIGKLEEEIRLAYSER